MDAQKEGTEKPAVIREFETASVYAALHPVEHASGSRTINAVLAETYP